MGLPDHDGSQAANLRLPRPGEREFWRLAAHARALDVCQVVKPDGKPATLADVHARMDVLARQIQAKAAR